jgi:hypothetical protein
MAVPAIFRFDRTLACALGTAPPGGPIRGDYEDYIDCCKSPEDCGKIEEEPIANLRQEAVTFEREGTYE